MLRVFFAPQEGQTLVEYALIILLVAVALAAALTALAVPLNTFFTNASTAF